MTEPFPTTGVGVNRREVLASARAKAAAWFEVDPRCLALTIEEIRAEIEDQRLASVDHGAALYSADVTAKINHAWERPAYGPVRCTSCRKEDWGR